MRKHLSWTSVLGLLILSGLLGALFWQGGDPRVVPLFVSFLVLGELSSLFRYRLGVVCPKCGFDPLLYKKDPRRASARVREVYERRRQEPDFLLTGRAFREAQRRQSRPSSDLTRAMERHSSPEV